MMVKTEKDDSREYKNILRKHIKKWSIELEIVYHAQCSTSMLITTNNYSCGAVLLMETVKARVNEKTFIEK